MIFQQINASDPERVFAIMYNAEGIAGTMSTLPEGGIVMWATTSHQNGTLFAQPDTGCEFGIVGALHVSIASNSTTPVLVQVYGYDDDTLIYMTNFTYVAGQPLIPVGGSNCLSTVVSSWATNASGTIFHTVGTPAYIHSGSGTSTVAGAPVFLRCM